MTHRCSMIKSIVLQIISIKKKIIMELHITHLCTPFAEIGVSGLRKFMQDINEPNLPQFVLALLGTCIPM